MELEWRNRGLVVAVVGGRSIAIGGEALLRGDPDYLVYAQYVKAWSDGSPLTDEERAQLLDDVVQEAERRGWKFEIVWS